VLLSLAALLFGKAAFCKFRQKFIKIHAFACQKSVNFYEL